MQIPSYLASLPPYHPGESVDSLSARLGRTPESIIKLDANENPYGPPPSVFRALSAISTYRYPDSEQRDLRSALAKYTRVDEEYLLAGNGSDELLSLLAQVLLQPGDSVLVCPPTFSMYAFYAQIKNCRVLNVPRRPDFSLDIDGIISTVQAESPKLVFIDSPGNPTGHLVSEADIEKLLELETIIVLDEAYIEFASASSSIRRVPELENLVVLRTFSKWASLAGLRVGYGAFPIWIGDLLWKAKSPYNLTHSAAVAAVAALDELDFLRTTVSHLLKERARLAVALSRFEGLTVYPTEGNFLLVKVGKPVFGKSSTQIYDSLKEQGILVRHFESIGCLRITVGLPEHSDILLAALSKIKHPQS